MKPNGNSSSRLVQKVWALQILVDFKPLISSPKKMEQKICYECDATFFENVYLIGLLSSQYIKVLQFIVRLYSFSARLILGDYFRFPSDCVQDILCLTPKF